MQPYWFPYLGYFQLLQNVDRFMLLDTMNHKPRGWVNRNRILNGHRPTWLSLTLANSSQNVLLKDLQCFEKEKGALMLLKRLQSAYEKAPYYQFAMPVLETIINDPNSHFVSTVEYMFNHICEYLAIDTPRVLASDQNLLVRKGENRIVALCRQQQATQYINLSGGDTVYSRQDFAKKNIELMFMKMKPIRYDQFKEPFAPSLSIIDVMMFNSPRKIRDLLNRYDIC